MSLKPVALLAVALSLGACASNPKMDAGRFPFMIGCWQSADGANKEVWSYPEGGIMFGYATTKKDGAMTTWEQSRIDSRPSRATYTASPEGQRPITFVEAPSLGAPGAGPASAVVFENGDHDYPQRIAYRAVDGGLAATISKLDGTRPVEYSWTRCQR
jgi:Domain of unknown function (DUF6265)